MSMTELFRKYQSLEPHTKFILWMILVMIASFLISTYGPGQLYFLKYVGFGLLGLIAIYVTHRRMCPRRPNTTHATQNISLPTQQLNLASSTAQPPTTSSSDQPLDTGLPSSSSELPAPLPHSVLSPCAADAPPPYMTLSFPNQQAMLQNDLLPPPPSYDEAVGQAGRGLSSS